MEALLPSDCPGNTKRWVIRRKAVVVGPWCGLISMEDACGATAERRGISSLATCNRPFWMLACAPHASAVPQLEPFSFASRSSQKSLR